MNLCDGIGQEQSALEDWFFKCELICHHLGHELKWPGEARKTELNSREPLFYGCLGFIDGIQVKIQATL
jgi:hypothetical protein